MEDTDLLAMGLREEERVGTGIDRPLASTSASLFERGTTFTEDRHILTGICSGALMHQLNFYQC